MFSNVFLGAGDSKLWEGLDDALSQALPLEAIEWIRPLGRTTRSVKVGASFVPFSVSALPHESNRDLIRQPILHIYWTECPVSNYTSINKKY